MTKGIVDYKLIRVTKTEDYIIPINKNGTSYNDWTPEQILEEWFTGERANLNSYHVSRENNRVGNSVILIKAELIDGVPEDYKILQK